MQGVCIAFSLFVLAILGLIIYFLFVRGFSAISWDLIRGVPTGDPHNPGGLWNGIVGTCILVALASMVGIPMGVLAGVYLSEYEAGSRIAAPVRFVSDVLAGVPSIVVGILGYELLVVPFTSGTLMGFRLPLIADALQAMGIKNNAWAGAGALAFIMVPIVSRTTEEMLRLVPNSYREASIALGATKAKTIVQVVLPSAAGSVVTGVMLAIARIAGETAPLIFTALGSRFVPFYTNPETGYEISQWRDLNQPFPSLTKEVYDYAMGTTDEQKRVAMAGILVLISLIFVVNIGIRFAIRRPAHAK
jgi:phosphate transport system permease protein